MKRHALIARNIDADMRNHEQESFNEQNHEKACFDCEKQRRVMYKCATYVYKVKTTYILTITVLLLLTKLLRITEPFAHQSCDFDIDKDSTTLLCNGFRKQSFTSSRGSEEKNAFLRT